MAVFKSKAMHMLLHADACTEQMSRDKEWDKSLNEYFTGKEKSQQSKNRKIVARQREVSVAAEEKVKEQAKIDEKEREALLSRLISEETARNAAAVKSQSDFAANVQAQEAQRAEQQRRHKERLQQRLTDEESRRRIAAKVRRRRPPLSHVPRPPVQRRAQPAAARLAGNGNPGFGLEGGPYWVRILWALARAGTGGLGSAAARVPSSMRACAASQRVVIRRSCPPAAPTHPHTMHCGQCGRHKWRTRNGDTTR